MNGNTSTKNLNKLDMPFYGAFGMCCIAFLLTLISFASPYWLEAYPETDERILRLGLWSVCFDRYIQPRDNHGNVWNGCYWIFNWDLITLNLWEYLGKWLISVQVLMSVAFALQCASMICMILYFLLYGQPAAESMMSLFCQGFAGFLIFLGVMTFGIKSEDRWWMPRPDHNHLSWAFGFGVLASLASFMACGFLYCVCQSDKSLQEEYDYYERYGQMLPPGGPDDVFGPGSQIGGASYVGGPIQPGSQMGGASYMGGQMHPGEAHGSLAYSTGHHPGSMQA